MAETAYYNIITENVTQTVNEIISEFGITLTVEQFIYLNKTSIIAGYDEWDDKSNIDSNSGSTEIKPNTTLFVPKASIKIEDLSLFSEGQVAYQENSKLFLGSHVGLIEDERYVRSNKSIIKDRSVDISMLNESATIWWYSFANDTIYNILPFTTNINTSKQRTGSFSLTLLPTRHDLNTMSPQSDGTYLNQYSTDKIGISSEYYADFFETYMQENDLIFIKYEELEIDKVSKPIDNRSGLIIPNHYLHKDPAICWDMIGLVNKSRSSYSARLNDKSIHVNGSDFTKMFEKDGSYFLPYQFIQSKNGESKFVWGYNESSSWFKRNMISGEFNSFFSYSLKSIDSVLKFIINHLSNLSITPNSLWDSYGDKLAKVYEIDGDTISQSGERLNGIWSIVQLNFDNFVTERRVVSQNLINPQGNLSSFINSICQEPFVECIMDTYTDEFEITVRQPPFNKKSIQSVYTDKSYITISGSDIISFNAENETEFYSYYELEPSNQLIGNEDGLFASIIPIVSLPFYCERFGNVGYKKPDNYINRVSVEGDNGKQSENSLVSMIDGFLNDLIYVIESTAYLPFTRRATMTINGDRRIKANSFIYNEASNELYYVDSVTNVMSITNNSIDRTTQLTLSRGMVLDNILDPYTTLEIKFSYFQIVDTDLLKKKIQNSVSDNLKQKDFDVEVNEDAFNYFITRQHMPKNFI